MTDHDLDQPRIMAIDGGTPAPSAIIVPGADIVHVVTRSELVTDLESWPEIADIVPTPDRAFLRGRFVHGGHPVNGNGHLFRTEQLAKAHLAVRHAPLNMLHRTQHVLGAFAATRLLYPAGTATDAASGEYTEAPWVEALAALWKWAFPDEYDAVHAAHDKGLAFLSQEGIPKSATCVVCGHNAPWKGYVSDQNCEHMNRPRAPRWIEDPLFVGGAVVIPPARPGWKDATITRIAAHLERHPAEAEAVYEQVAAVATHLDFSEAEAVMALLLDHAHPGVDRERARKVIAPMWQSVADRYPGLDFTPPPVVADAAATGLAAAGTGLDAGVVLRARNLAERRPQPPATVRRLASDLVMARPIEPVLFAAWGGQAALEWAAGLVDRMDTIDADGGVAKPRFTTAMVCLRPPADIADAVAAAGNQPADEVHVTVIYFGEVDGDTLAGSTITRDQLTKATGIIVAGTPPMTAQLSGIGVFRQPDVDVTWVPIDCPGLAQLYTRLATGYELAGIPFATNHGFTAHMTVAETPHGEGPAGMPTGEWAVGSVELWWADEHHTIPFGPDER